MIQLVEHPLVLNELAVLRNKHTTSEAFRASMNRISYHLAFEAYRRLAVDEIEVESPFEKTLGHSIADPVVVMPVLRAGLAMLDAFRDLLPAAKLGYIGLWKNEYTNSIEEYHFSIPKIRPESTVFLLDPMIASGHTMCSALSRLQIEAVERVTIVSVIAAPEGVETIMTDYPHVSIIAAALDRALNGKGYILPGLGDAGDRYTGNDI